MTGLLVLIIVAAALMLLSLVRIGGVVHYDQDGVKAWLKVGPWKFMLYPSEKKKKHKEKGKTLKILRKMRKKIIDRGEASAVR